MPCSERLQRLVCCWGWEEEKRKGRKGKRRISSSRWSCIRRGETNKSSRVMPMPNGAADLICLEPSLTSLSLTSSITFNSLYGVHGTHSRTRDPTFWRCGSPTHSQSCKHGGKHGGMLNSRAGIAAVGSGTDPAGPAGPLVRGTS